MPLTLDQVMQGMRSYFIEHKFTDVDVRLNGNGKHDVKKLKNKNSGKGSIVIGDSNKPLQTIEFHFKKRSALNVWRVRLYGDYLADSGLEFYLDDKDRIAFEPYEDLGLFGDKSPNLRAAYKILPSLKTLVRSEYFSGLARGLLEVSVSARIFSNLKGAAVASALTDFVASMPGKYKGEKKGVKFNKERLAPYTPTAKIEKIFQQYCGFVNERPWQVRLGLEDYLSAKFKELKEPKGFEENYLAKLEDISLVLKSAKDNEQKSAGIFKIIFGSRAASMEKDEVLYDHLRNLTAINTDNIELSLKKFFRSVSGIHPESQPSDKIDKPEKLWLRPRFSDLVENLRSVVKHGFYEESEDVMLIKRDDRMLKQLKEKKTLKREDFSGVEHIVQEYYSFLLTDQQHLSDEADNIMGRQFLNRARQVVEDILQKNSFNIKSIRYIQKLAAGYERFLSNVKSCLPTKPEQIAQTNYDAVGDIDSKIDGVKALINDLQDLQVQETDAQKQPFSVDIHRNALGSLLTYSISKLENQKGGKPLRSLEDRISAVKLLLDKESGAKEIPEEAVDLLINYKEAKTAAIRKAGLPEKKVYCTLDEAMKKFVKEPIGRYKREINDAEFHRLNKEYFSLMKKSKFGEMAYNGMMLGLLGLSEKVISVIPGGPVLNSIIWGSLIGSGSFCDGFCISYGSRISEYYLLVKYRRKMEEKGLDAEAAFSDMSSVLSRAYLAGYVTGTASGMPFLYTTTEQRKWPILIPITVAAAIIPLSFMKWFKFKREATKETLPKDFVM
ncbi:MAG: hypothetical protein V1866_00365 [archaeon]